VARLPAPRRSLNAGARLALALSLLARLRAAQATGDLQDERRLAEGLPATPTAFHQVLGRLAAGGLAVRSNGDRWLLARDLSKATLEELCSALGLDLAPGQGWPRTATAAVLGLEKAEGTILRLTLPPAAVFAVIAAVVSFAL